MRVAVRNAADKNQVNGSSSIRDMELDDVKRILSTEHGKRFLCRLIERTGLLCLSFTERDSSFTFFKEGERGIGRWLMEEIEQADTNGFISVLSKRVESNRYE